MKVMVMDIVTVVRVMDIVSVVRVMDIVTIQDTDTHTPLLVPLRLRSCRVCDTTSAQSTETNSCIWKFLCGCNLLYAYSLHTSIFIIEAVKYFDYDVSSIICFINQLMEAFQSYDY